MTCSECNSARYVPSSLDCSYQIKCEKTGKLHGLYDACDVTATAATTSTTSNTSTENVDNSRKRVACIICGEPTVLPRGRRYLVINGCIDHSVVCDKCKQAILRLRECETI